LEVRALPELPSELKELLQEEALLPCSKEWQAPLAPARQTATAFFLAPRQSVSAAQLAAVFSLSGPNLAVC